MTQCRRCLYAWTLLALPWSLAGLTTANQHTHKLALPKVAVQADLAKREQTLPVYVHSGDRSHPFVQRNITYNFTVEDSESLNYSFSHGLDHLQQHPCQPSATVYDIGFYDGADARSYLEGGYCVVGVEADPQLVNAAAQKFAVWIATGQLKMVNVAVAPSGSEPWTVFYLNKCTSEWNSFYSSVGCRACDPPHQENPAACDQYHLQAMQCGQIIATFGMPHYLKLDIEGAETGCFEALQHRGAGVTLPPFISAEITQIDYIDILHSIGYSRFKLVRQDKLHSGVSSHSGPWGDNALDCRTGVAWRAYSEVREEMVTILSKGFSPVDLCPGGIHKIREANPKATIYIWYDVHATIAP